MPSSSPPDPDSDEEAENHTQRQPTADETLLSSYSFGMNNLPPSLWHETDYDTDRTVDPGTMSTAGPEGPADGHSRRRDEVTTPVEGRRGKYRLPVYPKKVSDTLVLLITLENNILFTHLSDLELNVVVDAMSEVCIPKGTVIHEQDQPTGEAARFYVIMEGQCVSILNGQPIKVLGVGDTIGSRAMFHNKLYTTTVEALTDVRTFSLSSKGYKRLVTHLMSKKQELYMQCLAHTFIGQHLPRSKVVQLVDALEAQKLPANEKILEETKECSCIYIVLHGEIMVTRMMGNPDGVELGKLSGLSVVGEAPFLTRQPATVTCCALTELRIVKLEQKAFELIIGPAIAWLSEQLAVEAQVLEGLPPSRAHRTFGELPNGLTSVVEIIIEGTPKLRPERRSTTGSNGNAASAGLPPLAPLNDLTGAASNQDRASQRISFREQINSLSSSQPSSARIAETEVRPRPAVPPPLLPPKRSLSDECLHGSPTFPPARQLPTSTRPTIVEAPLGRVLSSDRTVPHGSKHRNSGAGPSTGIPGDELLGEIVRSEIDDCATPKTLGHHGSHRKIRRSQIRNIHTRSSGSLKDMADICSSPASLQHHHPSRESYMNGCHPDWSPADFRTHCCSQATPPAVPPWGCGEGVVWCMVPVQSCPCRGVMVGPLRPPKMCCHHPAAGPPPPPWMASGFPNPYMAPAWSSYWPSLPYGWCDETLVSHNITPEGQTPRDGQQDADPHIHSGHSEAPMRQSFSMRSGSPTERRCRRTRKVHRHKDEADHESGRIPHSQSVSPSSSPKLHKPWGSFSPCDMRAQPYYCSCYGPGLRHNHSCIPPSTSTLSEHTASKSKASTAVDPSTPQSPHSPSSCPPNTPTEVLAATKAGEARPQPAAAQCQTRSPKSRRGTKFVFSKDLPPDEDSNPPSAALDRTVSVTFAALESAENEPDEAIRGRRGTRFVFQKVPESDDDEKDGQQGASKVSFVAVESNGSEEDESIRQRRGTRFVFNLSCETDDDDDENTGASKVVTPAPEANGSPQNGSDQSKAPAASPEECGSIQSDISTPMAESNAAVSPTTPPTDPMNNSCSKLPPPAPVPSGASTPPVVPSTQSPSVSPLSSSDRPLSCPRSALSRPSLAGAGLDPAARRMSRKASVSFRPDVVDPPNPKGKSKPDSRPTEPAVEKAETSSPPSPVIRASSAKKPVHAPKLRARRESAICLDFDAYATHTSEEESKGTQSPGDISPLVRCTSAPVRPTQAPKLRARRESVFFVDVNGYPEVPEPSTPSPSKPSCPAEESKQKGKISAARSSEDIKALRSEVVARTMGARSPQNRTGISRARRMSIITDGQEIPEAPFQRAFSFSPSHVASSTANFADNKGIPGGTFQRSFPRTTSNIASSTTNIEGDKDLSLFNTDCPSVPSSPVSMSHQCQAAPHQEDNLNLVQNDGKGSEQATTEAEFAAAVAAAIEAGTSATAPSAAGLTTAATVVPTEVPNEDVSKEEAAQPPCTVAPGNSAPPRPTKRQMGLSLLERLEALQKTVSDQLEGFERPRQSKACNPSATEPDTDDERSIGQMAQ